jgi:hypothetical protein
MGRVRNIKSGHILTPQHSKRLNNYTTVCLSKNNKTSTFALGRLVLKHFQRDKICKNFVAHHIDFNHKNNKNSNLVKTTLSEHFRLVKKKNKDIGVSKVNIRGLDYWRAVLTIKKKIKTLGYFQTKQEAKECFQENYFKYNGIWLDMEGNVVA